MWNKRAQRALGRSPEEKVKGHSGAIYRESQGHNLNNFGRGPFDDVIYKYESSGPCSYTRRFLKIAVKKQMFDPATYLHNQSEPFEQFW